MLITGIGVFAIFSLSGLLFSGNSSIIYIAIVNALQSVAMAALISPSTTMALSGLKGQERVDGSAIYNTLRQISSSLASMLSILIFTLLGSNMTAIHGVYLYFGIITIMIMVLAILYFKTRKTAVTQA